ncbi:hypothetical protein SKAU_G00387440 [Synaphobranchus kaupii]|uniref:Reverse transcriptase domain-containing protein n=1 Tax=Synaphobranchus kaupii TaxID=118154 RepID=A0A9Q1IDA4_SYNKA|nr:hypothetical protein SKAU_G00387440 [Synaphobranchus kaupii]
MWHIMARGPFRQFLERCKTEDLGPFQVESMEHRNHRVVIVNMFDMNLPYESICRFLERYAKVGHINVECELVVCTEEPMEAEASSRLRGEMRRVKAAAAGERSSRAKLKADAKERPAEGAEEVDLELEDSEGLQPRKACKGPGESRKLVKLRAVQSRQSAGYIEELTSGQGEVLQQQQDKLDAAVLFYSVLFGREERDVEEGGQAGDTALEGGGTWRLVTLLCTDCKVLGKVLANRAKEVLGEVLGPDQTCGVPGRMGSQNLVLLWDVLSWARSRRGCLGVISFNQQKAFDRVDHGFLAQVLRKMGFGEGFIAWVKTLYNGVYSRVKVNKTKGHQP